MIVLEEYMTLEPNIQVLKVPASDQIVVLYKNHEYFFASIEDACRFVERASYCDLN